MLKLLALCSAALAALATGATVKDCGGGATVFTVNKVGIDPVNPTSGQEVSLLLDYTVPEGVTVTDGLTTYQVTLNFIPFAPSTNPVCQDIPCPLGPGSYTNITKSTWPSGVSGTFTSKMIWRDQDSRDLLCIAVSGALVTPRLPAPSARPQNVSAAATATETSEAVSTAEEPVHRPNATNRSAPHIRGGRIRA